MADMKKEQEREELHRAIWAIANELRGAVDGWNFKNYVLAPMFYRYISENLGSYINHGEWDAGNADFRYIDAFSNAYEYLMTMYASNTGKSGGAEQKIRKCLVDNNFIDCVIQLPANEITKIIAEIEVGG